jgi:hypothetical protein
MEPHGQVRACPPESVPPACATYLRPPKPGLRVGGSRFGEGRARRRGLLRRRMKPAQRKIAFFVPEMVDCFLVDF